MANLFIDAIKGIPKAGVDTAKRFVAGGLFKGGIFDTREEAPETFKEALDTGIKTRRENLASQFSNENIAENVMNFSPMGMASIAKTGAKKAVKPLFVKAKDLFVKEASKYKTAKQFEKALNIAMEDSWSGAKHPNADKLRKVLDDNFFHGTTNAKAIQEQGFKKGKYFNSGAYFSDKPNIAIEYSKQMRGGGSKPEVLVTKLDNLKIKELSYGELRSITKGDYSAESLVDSLRRLNYNGAKAKETGETFIWDVEKIKKPETLEELWKRAKAKGNTSIGAVLAGAGLGAAVAGASIPSKTSYEKGDLFVDKEQDPNKIKEVASRKGLYGDVKTLSTGIKKFGDKTDKFVPTEVIVPTKRMQDTIGKVYQDNPELPKGLLEAILMKESSMGSISKNQNKGIGEYAYLVGFTNDAKKELIRNGIVPDLNSHEGVLQAVADYWNLKKDLRNEDGSVRHTYDNMRKWYNERYSSGKLKEEDIEKFGQMFDYYAQR